MKLFHFAFVGSCNNETNFSFDQMPSVVICKEIELKETFDNLRKEFLKSFRDAHKPNMKSLKNFKIGITISIIHTDIEKARFKNIYINPLNLKIK